MDNIIEWEDPDMKTKVAFEGKVVGERYTFPVDGDYQVNGELHKNLKAGDYVELGPDPMITRIR